MIDELARLLRREELPRDTARVALDTILRDEVPVAAVAAFLALVQSRGATPGELAGFADSLAAAAIPVPDVPDRAIDTCGTGGDGRGTFNLSTIAALVAAAAGATVMKHGNRAATSRSGSADLLERLAVPIDLDPAAAVAVARKHRFAFLFARQYHPILAKLAPVRATIGFPTVFNLLGPLLNPARVRRQVVGVYDPPAQRCVAEALRLRGCDHALVLHGAGGLDEASPVGPFEALVVRGAAPIQEEVRDPAELGVRRCQLAALQVASAEESAAVARAILAGERGPRRDAVLLNAALALEVAAIAGDWKAGFERAAAAIDDGRAARLLEALQQRPAAAAPPSP